MNTPSSALSGQDIQDLTQIRKALPPDDPRRAKLDTLLGPEQDFEHPSNPNVKVVGHNAAGQPQVAPAPTSWLEGAKAAGITPEGIYNSAWNAVKKIPGSIGQLFAPPATPTEQGIGAVTGPLGLAVKRVGEGELGARRDLTAQAAQQFQQGHPVLGTGSTILAGLPVPGMAGIGAGVNQAVAENKYNEAIGAPLGYGAAALATEGALKGGPALLAKTRDVVRGSLRNATDTTPADVAGIVSKTSAQNAKKVERVGDLNAARAETDEARAARVKAANDKAVADTAAANAKAAADHAEKVKTIEASNAAKQAEFDAAQAKVDELTKAAQEQDTQKGQLARTTQQLGARIVDRIRAVKADAYSKVSAMYDKVRAATGPQIDLATGQPIPGTEAAAPAGALAGAVSKAEGMIKGSTENLKIFRDILSKDQEVDPDVLTDKTPGVNNLGTQPKGSTLYGLIKAMQGGEEGTPIGFRDLQGYYTELGEKLSGGNLPADVYLALKSLQEDIGKQMESLADSRGVVATLRQAKSMYKDYMESFRNDTGPNHSGSPIAQALNAKDLAWATKPLTAVESFQRVRNILARFDVPEDPAGGAAKLYDNFRGALRDYDKASESIKVPAAPKPPKIKETPAAPEPNQPDLKPAYQARQPLKAKTTDLTPESLEAAKAQRVMKEAESIKKSKSWVVNGLAAFGIIRSGLMGNWGMVGLDVAARVLYSAGKQGVAEALSDPKFVARLSKLTPEDYAAIQRLPASQRTAFAHSMAPVVEEAGKKGIKLDPALIGMTASGVGGLPPGHPLQQSIPQQ